MVVQNAQPPPKEEYRMRSGKVPVCVVALHATCFAVCNTYSAVVF